LRSKDRFNFRRIIMAEQINPANAGEMETPASGLLLSVDPIGNDINYKASAGDKSDESDADGTDGDRTDGTDGDSGSASDADGTDESDSDGTDDGDDTDVSADSDGTDSER
jgi:hypothetical protein